MCVCGQGEVQDLDLGKFHTNFCRSGNSNVFHELHWKHLDLVQGFCLTNALNAELSAVFQKGIKLFSKTEQSLTHWLAFQNTFDTFYDCIFHIQAQQCRALNAAHHHGPVEMFRPHFWEVLMSSLFMYSRWFAVKWMLKTFKNLKLSFVKQQGSDWGILGSKQLMFVSIFLVRFKMATVYQLLGAE